MSPEFTSDLESPAVTEISSARSETPVARKRRSVKVLKNRDFIAWKDLPVMAGLFHCPVLLIIQLVSFLILHGSQERLGLIG